MISNKGWVGITCCLASVSLGINGLFVAIPVGCSLLVAFFGVVVWMGFQRFSIIEAKAKQGIPQFAFHPPNTGLPFFENPRPKRVEGCTDLRITGAIKVDAPLNDIINYLFRDYIYTWYDEISDDPEFPQRLGIVVRGVIAAGARRAKDALWVDFLTSKLVDDFATHIRLFRKAELETKAGEDKDLYKYFFNLENEMEQGYRCRDFIASSDNEGQKIYWKEMIDVLLFLLMDPKDFHNKPFRVLVKEILINLVLIPTFEKLSDPEFINQTISWFCDDSSLNNEAFIEAVRTSDNLDELEAVKCKVEQDLFYHRSRDTCGKGREGRLEDKKQTIRSLEFLQKICVSKVTKLKAKESGESGEELDVESFFEGELSRYLQPGCVLYSVPLETVLGSNRALSYFIDFLSDPSSPKQQYVFFYLAIEAFKAQYQVELNQDITDQSFLKASAQAIYDQYLSPKAFPKVEASETHLSFLTCALNQSSVDMDIFQGLQDSVFDLLENDPKFYAKFKKQEAYVQLLADFDLLEGPDDGFPDVKDFDTASLHSKSSNDDYEATTSLSSSLLPATTLSISRSAQFLASLASSSLNPVSTLPKSPSFQRKGQHQVHPDQPTYFYSIHAKIQDTLIYDGDLASSSYAVYIIDVTRSSTLGAPEIWQVGRRYSDFDDLQRMLKKKFNDYQIALPGKNFNRFSNMNPSFLEKRRLALQVYLHTILSLPVLKKFVGSMEIIETFLTDNWDKSGAAGPLGDRLVAAADSVGSAIKNPFKAVTNTVRAFPHHLARGVKDVGENVKGASGSVKTGLGKLLGRGPVGVGDVVNDIASASRAFGGGVAALVGDSGRVGDSLQDEENIPLRITLLLFDEIFDLGSNQWLRRRLVAFLRQIIKATFGDTINKKIVDHMESYITPSQVAEYVKQLRDSFWVEGVPVPTPLPRDRACKSRLRILTKTKMLGSLPEDLKRFIGRDTSKRGILRLFELFQHKELNKRLLYVILEGVIRTAFPNNKIDEVLTRIYSLSPRISQKKSNTL